MICSRCGKENSRKGQRYCKECHAKYMRDNRVKYYLSYEQKKKASARSYCGVYARRGSIQQKLCEVCGLKAQRHHDNYDKPLEVRFLCVEHHRELHNRIKQGAEHGFY